MTIIEGLNQMKAAGITKLVGMAGITDIDTYIEHATQSHENAVKYAAMGIETWQYSLDHEDESRMIITEDGHHIIATKYGNIEMATYSDYETEAKMNAAYDEYCITEQAEAIADEMTATRPGELPRAAWVLIATAELKATHKAAMAAFEREFAQAH
jgi:uncharacterized short protein YbdD (DUF466 family)